MSAESRNPGKVEESVSSRPGKQPANQPANQSGDQQARPRIGSSFGDRIGDTSRSDEDLAELFVANWQKMAGGVVLLLLVLWLVSEFRARAEAERGQAAERFSVAEEEFDRLVINQSAEGDAKTRADNERAFQDKLKVLTSNYSGSTYARFAELYLANAALAGGRFDEAKQLLDKFSVQELKKPGAASAPGNDLTPEDFVNDLAALLYARLLVSEGKEPPQEIASYLEAAVSRASFTNVETLLVFYRFAAANDKPGTSELRVRADKAASDLVARRFELAEQVRRELENIGVQLQAP